MGGKRLKKTPAKAVILAVLLAVLLGGSALMADLSGDRGAAAEPPIQTESDEKEPSIPAELPVETVPDPEEEPETPWAPVAASDPVTDEYFDDIVFMGDSRTDGFRLYSGLDRGIYFCVTGETVASAVGLENWKTDSGEKITMADAVAVTDCGKIYLMLGVNELGWNGTDIFRAHAETLLLRLKADHPETEIVVQSLLPVTAEQDEKGTYVNNARIREYNQIWMELAEAHDVAYVNVAEILTDEAGCLPKDLSYDGVHLNKAGCRLWLDYLRTHSVGDAERLPPADEAPDEAGDAAPLETTP